MGARALFAVVMIALAAGAHGRECTALEETAAVTAAARLSNWRDIHATYALYRHCDDGAIAEGFSDAVVHLLATKWELLPELAALAKKDRRFYRFVLLHIEETTDPDERERIAALSRHKCPAPHHDLCGALRTAASRGR